MKKIVTIIGAGPAGIGIGILLKKMNIPFVILEKDSVGSSFKNWPKQMRFISPSFTGNFYGMPDLNAVSPETSPAYTLRTQHPTGIEYAFYLQEISDLYELPIQENCEVKKVFKKDGSFIIETKIGKYFSDYVIWAAGEFQYPNLTPFKGAKNCLHNTQIDSWEDLNESSYVIVGAYESGMDAAIQLAKLGKKTIVLDSGNVLDDTQSDSSHSLSPYTIDRYRKYKSKITIISNSRVELVEKNSDNYVIHTSKGMELKTKVKPIIATGFKSSLVLVKDLFEYKNNQMQLTDKDESTNTNGLFLAGPQVRHGKVVLCFVYKYRQRFALIAEEISKRIGTKEETKQIIDFYKRRNFYLADLSCCKDECVC